MATHIVLQPRSENGSIRRFDETPICKELISHLQKHETELPPLIIKFGSSLNTPYFCTGNTDCSGCASRERKKPLHEEQIYFYFELLNISKLKLGEGGLFDFIKIAQKIGPNDIESRITLKPFSKFVFKTKYIVLKPEYKSNYDIMNKYTPFNLGRRLFSANPGMFTVHDEKPKNGEIYFEDSKSETDPSNYYIFHMILNSSEVKNNMEQIVEILKFCKKNIVQE